MLYCALHPFIGGTEVPLYEYECLKCGKKTEKIENVSGPHLKKCPRCGGKVERLQSAPAIQFKGSGWYVTDYARKSSAKESAVPETASASSDKKDSVGKDSSTKGNTTPKESKDKKSEKPAGKK
jgi:putative FmdB family regulatory protein